MILKWRTLFREQAEPSLKVYSGGVCSMVIREVIQSHNIKSFIYRHSPFVFLCCVLLALSGWADDQPIPVWDGSRTTPVHRIMLYDEAGETIVPDYRDSLPFSARYTCGPCHDYDTIGRGLHFNSSRPEAPSGRRGEPWIWVDETTGTQLPLSYRSWPGAWKPEALGLTPWKITQLFGRHLPGGDMSEPEDLFADVESRWEVSGRVEINCLGCHNASSLQDQSEWAKQMARENYRWAATAASGLGEVAGMASRLPDTWLVYDGPNPDDTEWAFPPFIRYDLNRFDSKDRAFLDLVYRPPDDRCLYCHSVHRIDSHRWQRQEDVHTAAGIGCADCHRNGLDHAMIRGYEGEARQRGLSELEEFTCQGCHAPELEDEGQTTAASDQKGRMGAPSPEHKGLPPIHFEKLTCTACHCGPVPGETPAGVRTSRANRLGIHGKARWYTDMPHVVEPIFAKQDNGKIAPHRLMWPAFWARREGDRVTPLSPEEVARRAVGVFEAERQVGDLLAALALDPDSTGEPVLLADGKLYRRNIDGEVDGEVYDGTMSGSLWGRRRVDGGIDPLTPLFDLDEQGMLDYEIESEILGTLTALSQSEVSFEQPVMIFNGRLYRRNFEGFLEWQDWAGEFAESSVPFWGWLSEERPVRPLVEPFVWAAVTKTDGIEQVLTEGQVALVLRSLRDSAGEAGGPDIDYVYVCGGKMFQLDDSSSSEDSGLKVLDHVSAEPSIWPFAHDVRPAAQSLGVGGCEDCHLKDSPFVFATVRGRGPLVTQAAATKSMHEFLDVDAGFQQLFARSFTLRPLFKALSVVAAVLIAGVLLLFALLGLRWVLQWISRSS